MSDNIPKDLCEKQVNNAYLDIPTEIWTDVFKLLPRRLLIQRVQPVNKVFKAICDRNVKSVHVIKRSVDFMWELSQEKALTQRQLKALAGHNCPLSGQLRLTNVQILYNGGIKAKLAVIRHSLDLFRHCQLIIHPKTHALCSSDELAEHCKAYLALLEPVKPSYIEMQLEEMDLTHLDELLRHPTTLNCPRLKLFGSSSAWDSRQAIFGWLHHRVDGMEHGEEEEEMRCLILSYYATIAFTEWLLVQCIQNFHQSKVPGDRRSFVLTLYHPHLWHQDLPNTYEHKNQATGEVLLLERLMHANGQPTRKYCLVRCMASRVANNNNGTGTGQLYTKLFNKSISDFNLERGEDVAKVTICGEFA